MQKARDERQRKYIEIRKQAVIAIIVTDTDGHISTVTCSKSSLSILGTATEAMLLHAILCPPHRHNTMLRRSCNRPTCMNVRAVTLSTAGCFQNNSVLL